MIARPAIEALGADYDQWRVLTRTMLRNDLRSASSLQLNTGEKKSGNSTVWLNFLLYGGFGLWVAMMAFAVPGLFLGGTIALSAAGVMADFEVAGVFAGTARCFHARSGSVPA